MGKREDELSVLTNLVFERSCHKLRSLVAQEAELRRAFESLDDDFSFEPSSGIDERTQVRTKSEGLSANWEIWVGQRKSKLNAALAAVLAEKNLEIAKVQKDFGRDLVAQRLAVMSKV